MQHMISVNGILLTASESLVETELMSFSVYAISIFCIGIYGMSEKPSRLLALIGPLPACTVLIAGPTPFKLVCATWVFASGWVSFLDRQTHRIPNTWSGGLFLISVVGVTLEVILKDDVMRPFSGIVFGLGLTLALAILSILNSKIIGMGDVKLLASSILLVSYGAIEDLAKLFTVLSIGGLVTVLGLALRNRRFPSPASKVPLAAAIALATTFTLVTIQ